MSHVKCHPTAEISGSPDSLNLFRGSRYDTPLQTWPERVRLATACSTTSAGTSSVNTYLASFVKAGPVRTAGNRPSNLFVTSEALRDAVENGLFNQKAVFIDHANPFAYPSLRNLIGCTRNARWLADIQSVIGKIQLYDTPDARVVNQLLQQLLEDSANAPDIGLSIVFYPVIEETGNMRTITAINHVESIDLVFEPAADGRILQALSALSIHQSSPPKTQGEMTMSIQDNLNEIQKNQPLNDQGAEIAQWLQAIATATATAMINAADLPQKSKERLLSQSYADPAQVRKVIEEEKAYLASLIEDDVIKLSPTAPRGGHIQVGRSGFDELALAFEALLDGKRPPDGIQPLSGLREFYHLLSGDYDLTGVYQPERIRFANVNCTTMAGLVANALNKRVVNEFMRYPAWWEPITIPMDFTSLQQVKWITLAGVGELPTVTEGAAYTELQWDDKTETASFVKKGGYLGITIEAIDKDDTGRLRSAPRALAQAAYLTLAKAVSNIFTANAGVGPTMSDSNALFHASHGNLGNSALTAESWAATRSAMRSQQELDGGSGSPAYLGALTAPRFLLVPNELENTALQILGAATAGSANYLDNVWAEGNTYMERLLSARARVIVMDMWSDVNDWAAVADPKLYPTIGIGYRYGRTPEIFSVASPTSGLMFTNDVMPVKVRFFFAVGPMDWKGLYKHNVS